MIATAQLRGLGVSTSAIKRAVDRGRLHRVHHGVYSLIPARARPAFAAEHAAVLACGPCAVLSHATAAGLHGLPLPGRPTAVQLIVVGSHRHPRPGLVVHRAAHLRPAEHHRLHGLPVTSIARTVLDLAPGLATPTLEALIDRALRRTSSAKLREVAARHPRSAGSSRIRALLDPARPSADTWTEAERRLLDLIRRAGLPPPEANVPVGRYTPDLLWRTERVIVEYDSDEFHSGPAAVRWDTERHNHLTALGYAVIHVTREELKLRPERILVEIAAALARAA